MNMSEARMFIRNYEKLLVVFGPEILAAEVAKFRVEDFSSIDHVPIGSTIDAYYREKGYPVEEEKCIWTFQENKGNTDWHRHVKKAARAYRVPDQCQCSEGELITACLIAKWPFLRHFEFRAYHLDNVGNYEIYVETTKGKTLYVPIMALMRKDFSVVKKRMKKYWGDYYRLNASMLKEALSALDTTTAETLRGYMEGALQDDPEIPSMRPVKPPHALPEAQKSFMETQIDGMRKVLTGYAGTGKALDALRLFREALAG